MPAITVPPIVQTRKLEFEPAVAPTYPKKLKLNPMQHVICAVGSVVPAVLVSRPIVNLQMFYFLSFIPSEMSQKEKSARFYHTLFTTKWFRGTAPFVMETAGWSALLVANEQTERLVSRDGYRPVSGFLSGALTGLAASAIKHPYDVLRATAEHPTQRQFKTPFAVLMGSVRHSPKNLLTIYKGFWTAAAGCVVQYSVMFGLWEMVKRNGFEGSPYRAISYAYCCVLAAHVAQYPVHSTKQALWDHNSQKRHGGISVRRYLLEQRKKQGMSVVWSGFFNSRPLIGCVTGTIVLTSFDYAKRWVFEQQTGSKS